MSPGRRREQFFAELARVCRVSAAQDFLNAWAGHLVLPHFRGKPITPDLLESMEQLAEHELGLAGMRDLAVWAQVRGPRVQLQVLPGDAPLPPEIVRARPRILRAV
jgi:hypothetical protein